LDDVAVLIEKIKVTVGYRRLPGVTVDKNFKLQTPKFNEVSKFKPGEAAGWDELRLHLAGRRNITWWRRRREQGRCAGIALLISIFIFLSQHRTDAWVRIRAKFGDIWCRKLVASWGS
jgi:hypothetical protein